MGEEENDIATELDPNVIIEKRFGLKLAVTDLDKLNTIGGSLQDIGRSLGNTITTEIAQSRGNWEVVITADLRKVHQL